MAYAKCKVYKHTLAYNHISYYKELFSSLRFHNDCMFFDHIGLLALFQGEAYLNNLSNCSKAQILMHGFKGELSMNMFLNI